MTGPRGRPRSFDRTDALRRVMEVFWEKGYECTQLNDLTAAIGVTPPSFYAAFGSKEAAFREAVELYRTTIGSFLMKALVSGESAHVSIRAMLKASIDVAVTAPNSAGCLLITGVANCQPANATLATLLKEIRRDNIAQIQARLEQASKSGEIAPSADTAALARFYSGLLQAISMQARDGMSREELEATLDPAMAALDRPNL